jgi:hypothetical protein
LAPVRRAAFERAVAVTMLAAVPPCTVVPLAVREQHAARAVLAATSPLAVVHAAVCEALPAAAIAQALAPFAVVHTAIVPALHTVPMLETGFESPGVVGAVEVRGRRGGRVDTFDRRSHCARGPSWGTVAGKRCTTSARKSREALERIEADDGRNRGNPQEESSTPRSGETGGEHLQSGHVCIIGHVIGHPNYYWELRLHYSTSVPYLILCFAAGCQSASRLYSTHSPRHRTLFGLRCSPGLVRTVSWRCLARPGRKAHYCNGDNGFIDT